MQLKKLHIQTRFKNIDNLEINFTNKDGLAVFIGNNGSGKSNLLEALSSIFAGLYNNKLSPSFDYIIEYAIQDKTVQVTYKVEGNKYQITIDGVEDNIKLVYLPSRVVANYSGEESRLWNTHYAPFYSDYIQAIKGATLPTLPLVFVNKYYWDIALLTLHYYDFEAFADIKDFCQNEIGITQVNTITFNFDTANIATYQENPVVNFVKAINPNNEATLTLTLAELKEKLTYITNEREIFNYLTAAFMPKDSKLITGITFNFNQNLTTQCLSEGEKKLILVKLILEVIGDENSLILLDEPDSHIHISRKQDLYKLVEQYSNRQNIITTHSPTLTHCFDSKHIVMLSKNATNDAAIVQKEKQAIVYELTNGIWSYQQQNIFLSSSKDILLVEGVTDITYITEAIKRLRVVEPKYNVLDFEFLPFNGAEGIKSFTNKFKPKINQKIFALLDRDSEGKKPLEKILSKPIDLDKFSHEVFGSITFALYPKIKRWRGSNFIIEDYFGLRFHKKLTRHLLKTHKTSFKEFPNLSKQIKDKLPDLCTKPEFKDDDFKGFKTLLDKLLELKTI